MAIAKITVSIFVATILPRQTFIAVIRQDDLVEISLDLTFWCSKHHTREWITMFDDTLVMHAAQAARYVRLAAVWNRTYTVGSHTASVKGCFG
jgi:hypothetical protein